jgi:hypothetical protein
MIILITERMVKMNRMASMMKMQKMKKMNMIIKIKDKKGVNEKKRNEEIGKKNKIINNIFINIYIVLNHK